MLFIKILFTNHVWVQCVSFPVIALVHTLYIHIGIVQNSWEAINHLLCLKEFACVISIVVKKDKVCNTEKNVLYYLVDYRIVCK